MANRTDVGVAITVLRAALPQREISPQQFREMLTVWTPILEDIPADLLNQAVQAWISKDTPWLPSVGQLRNLAFDLVRPPSDELTPGEAWEELRLAIRRGPHAYLKGYYQWSSPVVRRAFEAVGGWSYFSVALTESEMADRAHFMRIYRDLQEHEERRRRMLPSVASYRRAILDPGTQAIPVPARGPAPELLPGGDAQDGVPPADPPSEDESPPELRQLAAGLRIDRPRPQPPGSEGPNGSS
jgi:hypothetical protein